MSDNKTKPSSGSVEAYLSSLLGPKQKDSRTLLKLMSSATGEPPMMWGSSIVGFGSYHYKYESGREGDTMVVGFSARKQALTLYGVVYYDQNLKTAAQLGTYSLGKGCLYIKKLSDVDIDVLYHMIKYAYKNKRVQP